MEEMQIQFMKEKRELELSNERLVLQNQEKEKSLKQLQQEFERQKLNQERITSALQDNIQRTISQTVGTAQSYRPIEIAQRQQYSGYKYE